MDVGSMLDFFCGGVENRTRNSRLRGGPCFADQEDEGLPLRLSSTSSRLTHGMDCLDRRNDRIEHRVERDVKRKETRVVSAGNVVSIGRGNRTLLAQL